MKRVIVWFRDDLRLQDNETLTEAIASVDEIIPVYIFDEATYSERQFGFRRTNTFRTQFLLEALTCLDVNLRERSSGLIVLKGKPEIELPQLASSYGAGLLFAQKGIAHEEQLTEQKVANELTKINCGIKLFHTGSLYREEDLPFSRYQLPDMFTTFRKLVEHATLVTAEIPAPTIIKSPSIPTLQLPTLEELNLTPLPIDNRAAIQFRGGETAAQERLQYYLFEAHAIQTYKTTRNGLIGADYSTKFSAWLALGCISPRSIYHAVKKYETTVTANESTYWVVFELLWREYFRWVMIKYGKLLFMKNGIKRNAPFSPIHSPEKLDNWVNGTTGIDFIDANMIELKLTGFMSNRGRQNIASYLCNDLKLDWRYGAAYFEQQLIDYDVCSNYGNWAYLAGVGNDPRANRHFNIEKQANDYDPNKQYRKLWLQKI